LEKAELAEPGKVYPLLIDAGVTSNVFLTGHAIRVEISSSNFPRFDRNPNTGRPFADETTLKKAQQMVYHSRQYPSHVLLPVIPASERQARLGGEFRSQNSESRSQNSERGKFGAHLPGRPDVGSVIPLAPPF